MSDIVECNCAKMRTGEGQVGPELGYHESVELQSAPMVPTNCNGIHMTAARVKVRWTNNGENEEFDGIFKRAYKACSFLVGND